MHAGARPSEMSVMMSKNINICGKLRVNIGQYVPKYRAKEAKLSGWMRGTWIKEVNARVYAAEGADAADSGSENSKMNIGTGANNPSAPQGFTTLEKTIQDTLGGEGQGGWKEVEGCWVLYPDKLKDDTAGERAPRCLIHFVGGAYVGAAPQLAYRPLLEALAERGALVVATPFATGFDHLRTVDEVYFKFSRCLKALGPKAQMLPSYGLGHSLGSLMQLLVCSRYVVPRSGNILMSFNNKPATDSIPFLSPFIAPSARALGPILSQLATSPLRSGVEQWVDILKDLSPDTFKQIIPLLDQLTPIYLDVAAGTKEFTPPPEESRTMIRDGYAVGRNLLLKFANDSIDETPVLASVLQSSAAKESLELTVKTLPGDHVRPLQQDLSKISPDLAQFTSQRLSESETFWNSISSLAEQASIPSVAKEQITGLAKTASDVTSLLGGAVGAPSQENATIEDLADEIAGWMGLPRKKTMTMAPTALPPPPSDEMDVI